MSVKERTKFNLKEAFWKLYKERPLSKISIKEITDTAGYNRGTFYNYYNDVTDMFEEIKYKLMPSEETVAIMLKGLKNNEWEKMMETEDTDLREKTLLLFGPNGDPDFIHEYRKDIRSKIINQTPGLDEKDQVILEYLLEFMLSGYLSVTLLWMENNEHLSENELESLFADIMDNGLKQILMEKLKVEE